MATRDIRSNVKMTIARAQAAITSTATSSAIDLKGFDGHVVLVDVGTWTDGTHTISITEGDTSGGSFTAVADTDLIGTEPVIDATDEDNVQYYVGYKGIKRYIKVTITCAGTTTGAVIGTYVISGYPRITPQNDS